MTDEALDLFAGPGGWSLACQRLGIREWGVEIDKAARATREAVGFRTVHDDVWTYQPDGTEGLIASPPCQTFSAAGKGTGRKALDDVLRAIKDERWRSLEDLRRVGEEVGDERTALVLTPLTHVWRSNPRWVALEQVPTVLPVWEACAEVLSGWGYSVWTGNLQAETFGVPQTRKRAILIASRDRDVTSPRPTHSRYYPRSPEKLDPGVKKWVSMAEALGWDEDTAHQRSNYSAGGAPGSTAAERGRTERPLSAPSVTITSKPHAWVFRRPSTTVVGSFRPEVIRAPGYRKAGDGPCQNAPGSVTSTVAERGLLQSFPDDFPWQGGPNKQALQVGNAIPPLLAEAILREATGL